MVSKGVSLSSEDGAKARERKRQSFGSSESHLQEKDPEERERTEWKKGKKVEGKAECRGGSLS